jgi:hypothetical protein
MASAIDAYNFLHVAYCTSNGDQLRYQKIALRNLEKALPAEASWAERKIVKPENYGWVMIDSWSTSGGHEGRARFPLMFLPIPAVVLLFWIFRWLSSERRLMSGAGVYSSRTRSAWATIQSPERQ